MREFSNKFTEHFNNGLKPKEDVKRNQQFLDDVVNLKVSKDFGLSPVDEVSIPSGIDLSGNSITISYPFPQLFIGKSITLLCDENAIYTVNKADWSLTEITTYDPYSESDSVSITGDGKWHFLDMGYSWFLFNGTTTVYRTAKDSIFGDTDKVFALENMHINTGTYLNGRSIMGGFAEGSFWRSDYDNFWQGFLNDISNTPSVSLDMPVKSNFVSWSSIGGGDVLFWILPDLAKQGLLDSEYGNTRSLLMDYLKRNELGFMPMPWDGEVQKIIPLGNGVMVYGTNGITYLPQVSDPVPTFGMKHLLDKGIYSRNSVSGTRMTHAFIDEDGYLWKVNSQLKLNKLGYRNHLNGLQNPSVFYKDQLNEFYISSSSEEFILTQSGLSKGNQSINSLSKDAAIAASLGITEGSFVTSKFDLGISGIKQLTAVTFGIGGSSQMEARVHYRFDKSNNFQTTDYKTLNKQGIVYMIVSGHEFKIELKVDDYNNLDKMDYLNVRYKVSDKRSIRGAYK